MKIGDNALNQVLADHDARFLLGVAGLHYDAGRTAQSHFSRAVELNHTGTSASRPPARCGRWRRRWYNKG